MFSIIVEKDAYVKSCAKYINPKHRGVHKQDYTGIDQTHQHTFDGDTVIIKMIYVRQLADQR